MSRTEYSTRGIDRAKDGRILGYNFMQVSQGLDLEGMPHQQELAALLARVTGITVT